MNTATIQPPAGTVVVPAGLLDDLMAKRGIVTRQLSEKSGLTEKTISGARRGRPITVRTLRKLDAALLLFPVLAGPIGDGLRGEVVEGS